MDNEPLSLATLGRGAAIERFDDELQRVLNNVIDPNTDLGARKITLTIVLKPNEARDACAVAIGCSAKLGGSKPVGTTVFLGRGKDGAVASEFDPKQLQMELDEQRRQSQATVRPLQANK